MTSHLRGSPFPSMCGRQFQPSFHVYSGSKSSTWCRSGRCGQRPAAGASVRVALSAPAAAVSPATTAPLECEVQQATTAAELRAAAFLRAVSFYSYPPGRSEYAARSHRHMKANAEWDALTAKVEGRDVAYRDLDVVPYIACVDDDDDAAEAAADAATRAVRQEILAALRSSLDACAQLPAEPAPHAPGPLGAQGAAAATAAATAAADAAPVALRPRRLVVGSLDLNVGHTLPSEELIGRLPQTEPRRRRAYLSNVCVAPAARRLGVARALLRHVEDAARRAGVEWLYVHVVADNAPAVALYCQASGFQVEQTESEATARALQRPRRLLLAKCLLGQQQQQQQQQQH